MYYEYGSVGSLDIGSGSASLGNNTFGGSANNSTQAGLVLCNSRGTGTRSADGDLWSMCPQPLVTGLLSCTILSGMPYADVLYYPAAGANPLNAVAGGCTVGN
jgi:hypothetical protein